LVTNCWPPPEVSLNLNTKEMGDLGLTPEEKDAILAFSKTLSDNQVPQLQGESKPIKKILESRDLHPA